MTAFADYLQTDTPCILPSIEGIHLPDDPVSWGLKIFRANPAESALQFTEVDARGEQHTQYVDEKDPANMDRFAEGITDGMPVHGRIAVVDFCADKGIGFIPWYPLAAGSLTDSEAFQSLANKYEASAGQLALAWLLAHPDCTAPVVGPSRSKPHLGHVAQALGLNLEADERARMSAWFEAATRAQS